MRRQTLHVTISAVTGTGATAQVLTDWKLDAGDKWNLVAGQISDIVGDIARGTLDLELCDGCDTWTSSQAVHETADRAMLCGTCHQEQETARRERRLPRAGGGA